MSDVGVVGVVFAAVIAFVALCATLRPAAGDAIRIALRGLAAIVAAAVPLTLALVELARRFGQ